ncbi:MAG TPA: outer membrane lipoprotein carrier protein LolA [Polyangiaceae bacterium]|jgi:outer membrane lipoprotein carrier protein|nr:outer membrane lipoprotein carrier protein LolA [Polyangiaceae bacterium]
MNRRDFGLLSLGAAYSFLDTDAFAQSAPAPTPPPAPPMSADALADKVQAFYDQAQTYQAEFKQRYTIYAYNRTKDSSGKVVFAKPGKMRWTYNSNGNVVVSDGREIKIYEQENSQMYLQKVDKTQYPAALSFLMGKGSLKQAFVLSMLDAQQLDFPGGYVLLGTPRDPTPAYQKIILYIDAASFLVRRSLMLDAQKNRNRFDFGAARVNEPVAPGTFQFTPPPGTNTIRP